MTTYKIAPVDNCRFCHGTGMVTEYHPWGNTTAAEYLTCDCCLEQLPEEYNELTDDFEVIGNGWGQGDGIIVRDGPEFEYDEEMDR